ncbi:MAG: hypothetical protein VB012_05500 [Erysipelotrichaceae bacterium]|nr:hypothetical protein [Erysipelotrichaceae bacterium]
MQAIMESAFDVVYLISVITLGIIMFTKANDQPLVRKFGLMAVLLGVGDAFHLIPRMYALWTTGLEANAALLGIGKLITSITMTIFYLILYYIYKERYQISEDRKLTLTMWGSAILRIVLCLLPQNEWLNYHQPLTFGILRNIPFAVMGVIIIILFARQASQHQDRIFKHMGLAVALSFGFYLPVVLFAEQIPLIGMLMIPKTLAYVWIVLMGFKLYRTSVIK